MRGNPKAVSWPVKIISISIHASTWEATKILADLVRDMIFQFTPLHERQPLSLEVCKSLYYFNSRLYMRGNAFAAGTKGTSTKFQFTPLHERQQQTSIHGGVWWAFQFTPLHERQHRYTIPMHRYGNFNSRLYMRGSMQHISKPERSADISIHASTWEAAIVIHIFKCVILFQFTPLHERQQYKPVFADKFFYFNSRLYMRGSIKPDQILFHIDISIHASTWEAAIICDACKAIMKFQFTPLHERQQQKRL